MSIDNNYCAYYYLLSRVKYVFTEKQTIYISYFKNIITYAINGCQWIINRLKDDN